MNVAQLAAADGRHGPQKDRSVLAALLGSHLENLARLLDDLNNLLAFLDGQREGLFAIDILARLQGFDADLRVPVVGSADGDDINVLPFEQLAIIGQGFGLGVLDGALGVIGIHVGHGQQIGEFAGPVHDAGPLPPDANGTQTRPVVLGLVLGLIAVAQVTDKAGQHGPDGGSPGRGLQKLTTILTL